MRNVFLAAGLASALILSACGKKEETTPVQSMPAPAEAAPSMAPEATPPAAEPAPAPAETPPAQ